MHRRSAREIDEPGGANGGGIGFVLGIATAQDVEAPHRAAEGLEPSAGVLHSAVGMLVGRGGRQDHDVGAAAGLQQPAVERALLLPLVATHEREHTSH